jgi:hypothetical protein
VPRRYGRDSVEFPVGVVASLSPVGFFVLSIPFAFVSTSLAVAIWFLVVPFGIAMNRRAPEGADALFS